MLLRIIYNCFVIPGGWIIFRLLAVVDRKARRGLRGRIRLLERLEKDIARLDPGGRRIWFHSSSMGEFEQAKPIIAEMKKRHPDARIIVTFFSPSGYEHSLNYKQADIITYIPFDSHAGAASFVGLIRPSAAVFVRYDVWPNHLWALRRAGVPTFLASATLREHSLQNLPVIGRLYRSLYDALDYILTVSPLDKKGFDSYGLTHPVVEVIGDTRYDQVLRRSAESRSRGVLDARILGDKKVLVVGSSWKEDENVLFPAFYRLFGSHPDFLVVHVPHEPTLENLERIESSLNGQLSFIRFSELGRYRNQQLVLIDSVGILMTLYQYAHVAYVGGSFGSGVHNVLEPAVYGIPVLFGPRHDNSQEASELLKEGAAYVCGDSEELQKRLGIFLDDEQARQEAGVSASRIVSRNAGATERFLAYLENVLYFQQGK